MPERVEEFLTWKRHNQGRAEATIHKYRGYLARLSTYLGEQPLTAATNDQLEAFAGLHMHSEGLAPRSRRALVAAIREFYKWLKRRGHITHNPAETLDYPQAGASLPLPLSLAHAERLMMQPDVTTFTGLRDAAIIAILIGCGLRLSGLVSLNQSSLLFYREEERERLVIRVREKGQKDRLVPAPDEARLLLRAYLGHEDLEHIDRLLPDGDQVLFVSLRNRTISADKYHGEARRFTARSVRDLIVRYGKAAGIPRAEQHPHAMRHLYGTELAEDDVDLLTRQALLGHADPKTTEIYTRLAMRKLVAAVEQANPLRKIRTPVSDLAKFMAGR